MHLIFSEHFSKIGEPEATKHCYYCRERERESLWPISFHIIILFTFCLLTLPTTSELVHLLLDRVSITDHHGGLASLCYKAHAECENLPTTTSGSSKERNSCNFFGQKMATGVLCSREFALCLACVLLAVPLLVAQDPSSLSLEHYSKTCPNYEHVVRTEMECAVRADSRNAALMLRLHFHDCFVQVSIQSIFSLLLCTDANLVHLNFNVRSGSCRVFSEKMWIYLLQGCDGSVLLDDTATLIGEKKAEQNVNSLKGFELVDKIKQKLEAECPGTVSCADLLAIAARDAVVLVNLTIPMFRIVIHKQ